MNILAVCHSDGKSQASALKKCKFEKCKWCYPNMQPYVHNTHIFGGNFYKDFYHRIVSQNGRSLFFYIVLPGRRYDVEIIFHKLLYIYYGGKYCIFRFSEKFGSTY